MVLKYGQLQKKKKDKHIHCLLNNAVIQNKLKCLKYVSVKNMAITCPKGITFSHLIQDFNLPPIFTVIAFPQSNQRSVQE